MRGVGIKYAINIYMILDEYFLLQVHKMKLFHLFVITIVLLLPVPYLCGATEYYVRPTEPTNTSCPGQPCLTFSQYINDSDHYFMSNTVFRFQSGIHQVNASVSIRNLHNISLIATERMKEPQIIILCKCSSEICQKSECNGFTFWNTSYIVIDSLRIVVNSQNKASVNGMTGLRFMSITNLYFLRCNVKTLKNRWSRSIDVSDGKHVHIRSLTLVGGGIDLRDSDNISITRVTAACCNKGISVICTMNTVIINVTIIAEHSGIHLKHTRNTDIRNATVHDSKNRGIILYKANVATICSTTLKHPGVRGIDIHKSEFITINNTFIVGQEVSLHTEGNVNYTMGIYLRHTTNVTIHYLIVTNTTFGVIVEKSKRVTLDNMTAVNWTGHSIYMRQASDTTMNSIVIRSDNADNSQRREMGIIITNSFNIMLTRSVFRYFNPTFLTISVTGQPAVVQLHDSWNVTLSECSFHDNNLTALKLVRAHMKVIGHLTFTGNRAYQGAAMTFISNSSMTLKETGYITFTNNSANHSGGAIYIVTRNFYTLSRSKFEFIAITVTECFLRVEGQRFQDRLVFTNSSAGHGGDVLYGGSLGTACTQIKKCGKCLGHFIKSSTIKPDTLSIVSSAPSRACFCNSSGVPDCLTVYYSIAHSLYPGQTIEVSVVVVGHNFGAVVGCNFGTVAGSVFAQFLSNEHMPQLEEGQTVQAAKQHHCNKLQYTILPKGEENHLVLTLTAVKRDVTEIEYVNESLQSQLVEYKKGMTYNIQDILDFPIFVDIRILPCPPGFELTHNQAKCGCKKNLRLLPNVACDVQNLTIQRSGLVWVGPLTDDNNTVIDVIMAQNCPLNYCRANSVNITLNQSDTQCNYNHSGTLCGGCQPGFSLALGSAQCLKCSNKYLALLIPLTLAGFVLVFLIKVLDLTISQGFINGLIFYANILQPNLHIFFPQMTRISPLTLFMAWLNLDLGIETCFVDGLTAYWKTWLQFVFPFYIWAIAGLIIISARYSTRLARVMGNNSVPVLATLFLLSYAKLLRTIITIMSYTVVDTPHGQKTVWSADGNIDYLGPQHRCLFVAAIATLLFLWLPYTLLLLLGQWLHKINHKCVTRTLMKMKPFLDAHYGPLKDKHHYWFGVLLCMRVIILLISAAIPTNNFSVFTLSMSITAVALISFTSIGPAVYHNTATSTFEISLFINLALLGLAKFYTNSAGGDQAAATYTLIGVAFTQFLGRILYQIYSLVKSLFSHCHVHDDDDEATENIWRYNTSVELSLPKWKTLDSDTPYQDAATTL